MVHLIQVAILPNDLTSVAVAIKSCKWHILWIFLIGINCLGIFRQVEFLGNTTFGIFWAPLILAAIPIAIVAYNTILVKDYSFAIFFWLRWTSPLSTPADLWLSKIHSIVSATESSSDSG
jgi:hypothetical protein